MQSADRVVNCGVLSVWWCISEQRYSAKEGGCVYVCFVGTRGKETANLNKRRSSLPCHSLFSVRTVPTTHFWAGIPGISTLTAQLRRTETTELVHTRHPPAPGSVTEPAAGGLAKVLPGAVGQGQTLAEAAGSALLAPAAFLLVTPKIPYACDTGHTWHFSS